MLRTIICFAGLLVAFTFVGCRTPRPDFNPLAPFGSSRVPAPGTGTYGKPDAYYPGAQPAQTYPTQPSSYTAPIGTAGRFQASTNSATNSSLGQWQPVGGTTNTQIAISGEPVGTGVRQTGVIRASHEQEISDTAPSWNTNAFTNANKAAAALQLSGTQTASPTTTAPINGMAVNDATQHAAPQLIQTPRQITPVPVNPYAASSNVAAWPAHARQAQAYPVGPAYITPVDSPAQYQAVVTGPTPTTSGPTASGAGQASTASSAVESPQLRWRSKYTPLIDSGTTTR